MHSKIKAWIVVLFAGISFIQVNAQEDSVYMDLPYYGEEFEDEYYADDYDYVEEEKVYKGFMPGIDFRWTRPTSSSRNRFQESMFGLSIECLYQFDKTKPLFAGVNFHWGQYDKEFLEYIEYLDFEEYLARETSYFQQLNFDLVLRYFPGLEFWILQPYFDVGAGPRCSYGYTSVTNVDLDENLSFHFEKGDWKLGYNFGIGTLINFRNLEDEFYGSFSVSYSGGPNTYFYTKGDFITYKEPPIDRFDRISIPVNFLRFNFGFRGYL